MPRFQKVIWSSCEEDYLKAHPTEPINQLSGYLAKSRSAVQKKMAELGGAGPKGPKMTARKKTNIGKRPDCDGTFLRSGWEANVYRILKLRGELVQYEPTTFSFAPFGVLKGTVSYCPDFQINHPEFKWLEVKGFLKRIDKTKIKRFLKFYPEEAKGLCVVTGSPTTAATKFFQELHIPIYAYYSDLRAEFKKTLTGWEG